MTGTIVASVVLTVTCGQVLATFGDDYWPTWRGPTAAGAAVKGNPPVTWSESENVKWRVEFPGRGSSSPIIWANKIFFLTAVPTQETPAPGATAGGRLSQAPSGKYTFDVVCLDRATGKLIWQKTMREEMPHEGHHPSHGFASYSPVTDGKHIWAGFGSRGLYCLDMDGNLKWGKDLPRMETVMSFGEGSSVALAGDAVIAVCDHQGQSTVFAFQKGTGELLWSKDRDEPTSWATPVAVEVKGRTQVIVSATNLVRSYDVETGDIIWQCSGQTRNVIPSPVIGFGKVFCTSGYRGNALQAIELGKTGDLSGSDAISWQVDRGTPYVSSPLLYGNRIYVHSVLKPVISCYEAQTGKALFTEQTLEGLDQVYASPVGAGGHVYCPGRNGVTVVLKNADTFEVVATNKLDDGLDASPAVVGDELYLKGNRYLYCIAKP
jgi:outer membrane protein assembly factor BamB